MAHNRSKITVLISEQAVASYQLPVASERQSFSPQMNADLRELTIPAKICLVFDFVLVHTKV
ncbi:MAG TPA: hypothetical protein VK699_02825 [Terriglobales bacterium]|nr:hypothetical protein [Terriglobales bacterium]